MTMPMPRESHAYSRESRWHSSCSSSQATHNDKLMSSPSRQQDALHYCQESAMNDVPMTIICIPSICSRELNPPPPPPPPFPASDRWQASPPSDRMSKRHSVSLPPRTAAAAPSRHIRRRMSSSDSAPTKPSPSYMFENGATLARKVTA